jgi:hypothetical protein
MAGQIKAVTQLARVVNDKRLPATGSMGTSVEMLEDFYGKNRMRNPMMATEVTKDRRRERSYEMMVPS